MGTENVYGRGIEFERFFKTRVVQGLLFGPPTTGSTQATGTGASDYNVNISHGLAVVDGVGYELAAQADYDLGHASTGSGILADGESIVYTFLLYRSQGDGLVYLKKIAGTIALTAAVVPVTDAEIDALFPEGTIWMRLADCTVNRTGDLTLTQTYDNLVRNLQNPPTVHSS